MVTRGVAVGRVGCGCPSPQRNRLQYNCANASMDTVFKVTHRKWKMAKAVFMTKAEAKYDDEYGLRYHFPHIYRQRIERTVGDWIIYYEPRRISDEPSSRGGRQAYFATARVTEIQRDPVREDHFYAILKDPLSFVRDVPLRENDFFYESSLRGADGKINMGTIRHAVRAISDQEFELITRTGITNMLAAETERTEVAYGLSEEQDAFERPIIEHLMARKFRDRAFAKVVKSAYEDTCAITGLKIINGGGRPEVQAAHIKPVEYSGPDLVGNGIALSSTVHWMFDRGLFSVDEDYSILMAKDRIPAPILGLVNPSGKILVPERLEYRPSQQFLDYHRSTWF